MKGGIRSWNHAEELDIDIDIDIDITKQKKLKNLCIVRDQLYDFPKKVNYKAVKIWMIFQKLKKGINQKVDQAGHDGAFF